MDVTGRALAGGFQVEVGFAGRALGLSAGIAVAEFVGAKSALLVGEEVT